MCNKTLYKSTVSTIAVNSGSTAVVMTPDDTLSPANGDRVSLIATTSVPVAGMSLPLQVTLNGGPVLVYDKYGNIMYGSNVKTRYVMRGYYGTNGASGTAHMILVNFPVEQTCSGSPA